MNKISRNNAFTLIELLIVIVIIGILAGVGLLRYGPVIENARSAEAYTVLAGIAAAEQSYYTENDTYALSFSDLDWYDSTPASDNFTYSLESSYAKAAPKSGSITYYMCFNGTKTTDPTNDCL
ncbi:MAG: prepilin-type N-terminal cleavage/methylation domain-containing protein [Candidatus Omnitrophica bacterium]|nr:prepilin-type N-terminal cleavage/methylation domain-containing protein [Candidatus Omnitrophota bacterium]